MIFDYESETQGHELNALLNTIRILLESITICVPSTEVKNINENDFKSNVSKSLEKIIKNLRVFTFGCLYNCPQN